jgi:hypothetical protein
MANQSLHNQLELSSSDVNQCSDLGPEVDSRARSFFLTNKDLFEYDKYVGSTDPFDPACSSPSRGPSLSFLDRYRACDEQYSSTSDDVGYLLAVPAIASSILSIPLPSAASRSPPRTNYRPPALLSASPLQSPPLSDSYSRQHQHFDFGEQHPTRLSLYQQRISPPKPLGCPLGRQEYALESLPASQSVHLPTSPLQRLNGEFSPQRVEASIASHETLPRSPPRHQQPGVFLARQASSTAFRMPAVSELLLDSSARRQQLAQRQMDEATKIQMLIGSKCVGRVSAATRNLPASIRKRLESSARVSARRERLYSVLLQDYQRLAGM